VHAGVAAVKANAPAADELRAPGRGVVGLRIAEGKREGAISGLRISEMLGLVWDDVDFAAGVIHVRAQLSRAEDSGLGA
jgi:integrase